MPTYEYACSECKRHFEVVQSFSDAPLTTCEECGGSLKRVFHPVGIVLKGSGFYATDNRSGKSLASSSSSEGSSDGGSGSKDSKTSTKDTTSSKGSARDKK